MVARFSPGEHRRKVMPILDDAKHSGRDTWHPNKSMSATLLNIGVVAALIGVSILALVAAGGLS